MKTVSDIRKEFLGFFARHNHRIVPSSPLVPQNDPTLMFVNAGMVQFKDVFTGKEKRDYQRAATAQKCVRAGGKHNDLDNVGYTARHHTFFEMLGNFSFGDYFKDDAIAMAWQLVTKDFGLSPDRLMVTVHSSDEEAAGIWKKVTGFNDSKIVRIPTSDNFWAMGDTGPCGPCTEIFFDHGEHIPGGPPGSPDADGDRFIEIWNNVFMQFEQVDMKTRINLPAPSVDTGMGLERIAAIMQGKHDNYDIDLMRSIIRNSADLTGVSPDGAQAPSHRVIADHLRCAAFLLADGVMPSNEGRGYVLRRIMRRGMRHAHLLGAKEPLMYRLVPTLTGLMGDAYPELRRAEAMITETLKMEEGRFRKTLDHGLKLLDEEIAKLPAGKKFSGETAFRLYDTFGFPLDLTQDALRAHGIDVDMEGFNAAMAKQKETARKSWAGSGDAATEKLWYELLEKTGPSEFLGYETESAEGQIAAIVVDGASVEQAGKGEKAAIITNQTPFYAESGGQAGDHGTIVNGDNIFSVEDTVKQVGKLWVHVGTVSSGVFRAGDAVQLRVDEARRGAIRANHSVTHLLHESLRRVLGEHVSQKGSRQDAASTRFDISHPKALSAEEIRRVEQDVNREIRGNTPVETRLMAIEDAMQSGAMALFGEKYGEEVRVVTMGSVAPGGNKPYSVELCGGTHVRQTGEIGLFKIVGESALAAGIRRIEGLTGDNALRYFEEQESRLLDIAAAVKASPAEAVERVKTLAAEKKKLEQQLSDLRRQLAAGGGQESTEMEGKPLPMGGRFFGKVVALPANELKPVVDQIKKNAGSAVVAIVSSSEGKASMVVGVTDDLTDRYNAVDLVKIGVAALGGKGGGGRPDMAQGGGPLAEKADEALTVVEKTALGV